MADEFTVGAPVLGVEVKCPYPNNFVPPVHYMFPGPIPIPEFVWFLFNLRLIQRLSLFIC